MNSPVLACHTVHPDFLVWLRETPGHDLHLREQMLRRQLTETEEIREFAMLYASLEHVQMEISRRRETPPESGSDLSLGVK